MIAVEEVLVPIKDREKIKRNQQAKKFRGSDAEGGEDNI